MYVQSLDNSSYYALFGLSSTSFYCQLRGPSGTFTHVIEQAKSFDPSVKTYWMITEQGGSGGGSGTFYFWTSPDGQNWTQEWSVVHNWDATQVGFYVTATYSGTGQQVILSNLNSNVTTPSYQGNIYLGEPIMGIWHDLLTTAQDRGTVPFITTLSDPESDSYGRAWTDVQNVQVTNGTDLYSMLQSACSTVNADYLMRPGFQLMIGQTEQGSISLGADRSGTIILREGRDEVTKQRTRVRDQILNIVGAENSDGHEISATDSDSITLWGQREGWYQTAAQVDPESMAIAAAAAASDAADEVLSWTITVPPNQPGKTIFKNYGSGDWVGLERPDFSAVDAVRVVGIAVSVDPTGQETHELTIQSYVQWMEQQLTYLANKLGGQFVEALGTTPVAPSKYGTGQVPTYFTPAQTIATLADVVGSTGQNAAPLVYNPATGKWQVAGSYDPVSGTQLGLAIPSAAGTVSIANGVVSVSGTPSPVVAPDGGGALPPAASNTSTPTGTVISDLTGTPRIITGAQSDGTVTVKEVNGSAPAAPDAPSVAGGVLGLIAGWDGLLAGAPPLSDFLYVQVHVSATSGFTPSSGTLQGTLAAGGLFGIGGLTAGTTYYVKLVAVSKSRVSSAASTQGSGVPTSVPANIPPGSIAGTAIQTGTITATQISATAGILGSQLASNAAITAGQVAFSARSIGGITTTVSGTQPSSAVTSDLWFNSSNGFQLYQYNGSSWQPFQFGTGAIAANSVTAALIAANTITAAQIAAGTITAAQIAAATITGSNIAAGTLTASLLQAGIIVAGIVNGTVLTGSTLQNSTTDPRTSINPDGSLTITNSFGTVIYEIGPDGTMYWFSQAGVLQMELQPGGTELIYQSATGPSGWDFEAPGLPAVIGSLTSATSSTTYQIPATNGSGDGDAIVVLASSTSTDAATSVTDSQSNVYTLLKSNTTGEYLQVFASVTGNPLSATDTITVHYGSANTHTKTLQALDCPGLTTTGLTDFASAAGATSASPSVSGTPSKTQDLVLAVVSNASGGGAPSVTPDGWVPLGTISTSGGTYLSVWYSTNASAAALAFATTITSAAWGAALVGLCNAVSYPASSQSFTTAHASIATSTAWSSDGQFSLKVTGSGSSPWSVTTPKFMVQPGTTASMQLAAYFPAALSAVSVTYTFYNSAGAQVGTAAGDQGTFAPAAGDIDLLTITGATVPASAATATLTIAEAAADASGTAFYIDVVEGAGGLVYSNSPVPTTDQFGNQIPEGVNFVGLPGQTNIFGVNSPYGDQLFGVDAEGNVAGTTLSATNDIILQGESMVDTLFPALPQGGVQAGWIDNSAYASGGWPTTSGWGTSELALFWISAPVVPGRAYWITLSGCRVQCSVSTMTLKLRLRGTTNGSTPTTGSDIIAGWFGGPEAQDSAATPYIGQYWVCPAGVTELNVVLTAACSAGSAYLSQFSSSTFAGINNGIAVIDMGTAANVNSWQVSAGSGGSGGTGGTVTQSFYAKQSWSFYGGGTQRNTNGTMYQGLQGPSNGYGSQYAYMDFSNVDAAIPAGATVTAASLRLTNVASYYSSGCTVALYAASTLNNHATFAAASAFSQYSIGKGQTLNKQQNTTSLIPYLTGGYPYLILGPVPWQGDSLEYGGEYYGAVGGSRSYQPMITATWTVA
jgi:hypothetical protein